MLLNSLRSTTLVTKGFVHEKITFQDIILPENQRDDAPIKKCALVNAKNYHIQCCILAVTQFHQAVIFGRVSTLRFAKGQDPIRSRPDTKISLITTCGL